MVGCQPPTWAVAPFSASRNHAPSAPSVPVFLSRAASVTMQTVAHLETTLQVRADDGAGTLTELLTPQKISSTGFCRSEISF